MQRLIILHTNDIHGRVEGLAGVATLVEQIRAENPRVPVLFLMQVILKNLLVG
jgi:2',3'-cyclic-nucleotide 2'-phosphodiesterase (5'-nucleotidase family)